jgi:hypothetical protein
LVFPFQESGTPGQQRIQISFSVVCPNSTIGQQLSRVNGWVRDKQRFFYKFIEMLTLCKSVKFSRSSVYFCKLLGNLKGGVVVLPFAPIPGKLQDIGNFNTSLRR